MSIYDSTGNGLKTAMPIAYRDEYPFWSQGDRVCKLIYETMMVNEDSYAPLALDTPCVRDRNAILVEETPPTINNTGFVTYDRIYATIGEGFVDYGISAYTLPGINSLTAGGPVSLSLTGVYRGQSGRRTYYKGFFVSTSADVGDQVVLKYDRQEVTIWLGSAVLSSWPLKDQVVQAIIKDDGDGKYIDILQVALWNGIVLKPFNYTIKSATSRLNRPVRSRPLPLKEIFEFVYTKSPDDIPTSRAGGEIYDPIEKIFVDTLTDATEPTAAEYLSSISLDPWVQSDSSSFDRWKGNIYLKRTPYVKVI